MVDGVPNLSLNFEWKNIGTWWETMRCWCFPMFSQQMFRILLNGITDDWQIFDIKGAAHRNMPPAPSADPSDPEAPMATSSPSAVKWDGGFVETFGALPKVLKPKDHEALELALKCDLHVLRELGLVDYSLLMAFHPKARRIRLAIIDFLQPYTLNKQHLCSASG